MPATPPPPPPSAAELLPCARAKGSCEVAAQSQDVMFDGALQGDDCAPLAGTLGLANERITVCFERK